MDSYYIWTALTALIFLGGFIGSMMSGGSIVVFTILAFLNTPVKTAIGTLKLAITILGLFSAITFLKGGAVNFKLTPPLTLSSVLGSILGAQIIISLPSEVVNIIVVLLICLGTFFSLRNEQSKSLEKSKTKPKRFLPVLAGFLLGMYIGTLGIASAIITISALISLFRLGMIEANGTSKMIIFANNLVACSIYALNSKVDLFLGTVVAVPIAIGSWAGAKAALKMESSKLRAIFLGTAALTIMKLLSEMI